MDCIPVVPSVAMCWVVKSESEESLDKMHPHYVVVLRTYQEHHFYLKKKNHNRIFFKALFQIRFWGRGWQDFNFFKQ